MPTLDRRISMSFEGSEREVWAERVALDVDADGARASFRVRHFTRTGGARVRPKDVGKVRDDYGQVWQVGGVMETERRRFMQIDCEALRR